MNYRHAYHAGNFADVHKHAVLTLLLGHLRRKDTPFHVLDTHAGIGIYDIEIAHSAEGPRGVLILIIDNADAETLRVAVEAAGYPGRAEQLS